MAAMLVSFKEWFLEHQVVDVESSSEASVIVAEIKLAPK